MADIRINDFSGGETDVYRDSPPNFCQTAYNLYITEQKGLIPRTAFTRVNSDQRPFSQKIDRIWHHEIRRSTLAPENNAHTFETFVASNGGVQRTDDEEGIWRILLSESGANVFFFETESQGNYVRINNNEFVLIQDNGTYPLRFYRESTNTEWSYTSLGLPRYGNPIAVGNVTPGGNNWTYALVLKRTYTFEEEGVGTVTKIVRSAPIFASITGTVETTVEGPGISAATVNQYDDNLGEALTASSVAYDYGELRWELYRTTHNGTVFYKVNEQATGLVFNDPLPDANITGGEVLYTTGGVAENGMITDRIRYGTFANDTLWLASSSRVWQSKIGIYDAFPGSFNFQTREGEFITSIKTIDIYPIVFTNLGVYRVEGIVSDQGSGTHRLRTVSEDYGALSNKTTVKAGNKIFFWSSDGIYETNGFAARKVSNHYDDRYCAIADIRAIDSNSQQIYGYELAHGSHDQKNSRITWFYPSQFASYSKNMLTLHLKYPNDQGYAITSGGVNFDTTDSSSIRGKIYFASQDGSAMKQSSNEAQFVDSSTTVGGLVDVIDWNYTSSVLSFGTSLVRKWFQRLLIDVYNKTTTFSFDVLNAREKSEDFREHNPIVEVGLPIKLHYFKRWFPKGTLRASFRQVRLLSRDSASTNGRVEIAAITMTFAGGQEGHTQSGVET